MLNVDFLTIVLDSLRYDTVSMASGTNITSLFDVELGYAQATYTYPAHASIFQSFYPSTHNDRPLYNRMIRSAIRWHYDKLRPSVIDLQANTSVPAAFKLLGHTTVCCGGVSWFKTKTPLSDGFDLFKYAFDVNKSIDSVIEIGDHPFYSLLNFGNTHKPYYRPGHDVPYVKPSGKYDIHYDENLHRQQALSYDYIDSTITKLFDWLMLRSRPTLVCFCSDHGECFGEDGYCGHGFYHQKVMEVPVGWSVFYDHSVTKISSKNVMALIDICAG